MAGLSQHSKHSNEIEILKLQMEIVKLKHERDKLLGNETIVNGGEFIRNAIVCPACLEKAMRFTYPCCGSPYWECSICGNTQKYAPTEIYTSIAKKEAGNG